MSAFDAFAARSSKVAGRPIAFMAAVGLILAWGVTGPLFHYSDTWQLVINTGTTIVTFLMCFLIQATQNRDAAALHAKIDELVRVTHDARNALIGEEQDAPEEIETLRVK
jgi:low affinity Fe/Cu permease